MPSTSRRHHFKGLLLSNSNPFAAKNFHCIYDILVVLSRSQRDSICLACEAASAAAPSTALKKGKQPEAHAEKIERQSRLHARERAIANIFLQVYAVISEVSRPKRSRTRSPEDAQHKIPKHPGNSFDGDEAMVSAGQN